MNTNIFGVTKKGNMDIQTDIPEYEYEYEYSSHTEHNPPICGHAQFAQAYPLNAK